MHLKTRNGKISLGSFYKLFVVAWLLSWGALFAIVLAIFAVAAALGGGITINGEVIVGQAEALLAVASAIGLAPLIITLNAFFYGGLLTFGIVLYRIWRPILILEETD